jgi:hypothetical protein
MRTPTICFPHGGGGSWLLNLIWQLENNQLTINNNTVVFDDYCKSTTVLGSHIYDLFDGQNPTYCDDLSQAEIIKFSSSRWFNLFITGAIKIKYHLMGLGNKTIQEQFYELTNLAKYMLTDELYRSTWGEPVDLNYALIFENSELFIDQVFALLDKFNVTYTQDREYCRQSVAHYRSTCPRTDEHLGNFDSLLWLSWVHACVLIDGKSLAGVPAESATVSDIRRIVEPVSAGIAERTGPMAIEWKE